MEQKITLQCPECGCEDFILPPGFNAENGYEGVTCGSCDRPLSNDDVSAQGAKVAKDAFDDMLRDSFKGTGWKLE
ncbi:ECs_2282 family putative zinc-binding protein [Rosenbergiella australiborealis]|uniref:ECs_2282 family putative zinc-binding protein n=1 Tax=Rosenbergiella australiborealis TaxID=1544696 RepID=UPI001F4DC661|nr:hypothetical protein [Rosenbergiella australiborealis]